jgi:hypothetical protein
MLAASRSTALMCSTMSLFTDSDTTNQKDQCFFYRDGPCRRAVPGRPVENSS